MAEVGPYAGMTGASLDGWVRIMPDPAAEFLWTCPLCGRGSYGKIGRARAGWDNPEWTQIGGIDGTPVFTLMPSIACQGTRDGSCAGHWWMKEGRLEPADASNG